MSKNCGCGGKIAGFSSNGFVEGALPVLTGYGGIWLGQKTTTMATDTKNGIKYFQENPETAKMILGGAKVATAIGLPMFFPRAINKMWQVAALIGWGGQGMGELIDGIDQTNGIGQPYDWDSYDPYKENRTDNANMV